MRVFACTAASCSYLAQLLRCTYSWQCCILVVPNPRRKPHTQFGVSTTLSRHRRQERLGFRQGIMASVFSFAARLLVHTWRSCCVAPTVGSAALSSICGESRTLSTTLNRHRRQERLGFRQGIMACVFSFAVRLLVHIFLHSCCVDLHTKPLRGHGAKNRDAWTTQLPHRRRNRLPGHNSGTHSHPTPAPTPEPTPKPTPHTGSGTHSHQTPCSVPM